jgi:hypothetical protein
MDISCDLYRGVVYIPTSYAIRKGFYFMHTPVAAVSAEQTDNLRDAFLEVMARGNPPITEDEVIELQAKHKGAMLQATGARSWSKYDRERTGVWSLLEDNGLYEIYVKCPLKPLGWHEDRRKRVVFPDGTSAEEAISRLVDMIQERQREVTS